MKEKRSRIKPLLARLHREFNISVAEVDFQDRWQETVIACALITNESAYTQRALSQVLHFVETSWPDMTLMDQHVEIF